MNFGTGTGTLTPLLTPNILTNCLNRGIFRESQYRKTQFSYNFYFDFHISMPGLKNQIEPKILARKRPGGRKRLLEIHYGRYIIMRDMSLILSEGKIDQSNI